VVLKEHQVSLSYLYRRSKRDCPCTFPNRGSTVLRAVSILLCIIKCHISWCTDCLQSRSRENFLPRHKYELLAHSEGRRYSLPEKETLGRISG
jgi:hypothetical protein